MPLQPIARGQNILASEQPEKLTEKAPVYLTDTDKIKYLSKMAKTSLRHTKKKCK